MPKDTTPGKPTTRRYSPEEKTAAVRVVRTLRAELATEHGTLQRVATQLGHGTESVRPWVRPADIEEGHVPGVSPNEAAKIKVFEQENRELKPANEMAVSGGQRNDLLVLNVGVVESIGVILRRCTPQGPVRRQRPGPWPTPV